MPWHLDMRMGLNVRLTVNVVNFVALYWAYKVFKRGKPPPVDNGKGHAEDIKEEKDESIKK